MPDWKKTLQEPNAFGWIGLIVVVALIGLGTLYFGGSGHRASEPPTSQAAR